MSIRRKNEALAGGAAGSETAEAIRAGPGAAGAAEAGSESFAGSSRRSMKNGSKFRQEYSRDREDIPWRAIRAAPSGKGPLGSGPRGGKVSAISRRAWHWRGETPIGHGGDPCAEKKSGSATVTGSSGKLSSARRTWQVELQEGASPSGSGAAKAEDPRAKEPREAKRRGRKARKVFMGKRK